MEKFESNVVQTNIDSAVSKLLPKRETENAYSSSSISQQNEKHKHISC